MDNDNKQTTGKTQADNAGENVAGIDQVLKYEHNVKGEVITELKDNNVDGTYDSREVKVRDANGNVVETQLDYTNDGKVDKVTKNTLNAKGEVLESKSYNQSADGVQTYTGKDVFERDENGYATKKTAYTSLDQIKLIEYYTNNSDGKVIEVRRDTNADNSIDSTTRYILDSNGNISRENRYVGDYQEGVSVVEKYTTYERDALGNATTTKTYTGENTLPDKTVVVTRDVYGNITHQEEYNEAGTLVTVFDMIYDAQNRVTDSYRDRAPIGSYSSGDVHTHIEYNAQGEYAKAERTYNYKSDNPVVDDTTWYTYDEFGRQKILYQDYDKDGKVSSAKDLVVTYEYNALGQQVVQINVNGDGTPRNTYYTDRDIDGTALYAYLDTLSNGSVDSIAFGNASGAYGKAQVEDLRTWIQNGQLVPKNQIEAIGFSELDFKGITGIQLSNNTNSTDITLDSKVIKALAPKSPLYIYGDATDTVNYKGTDLVASGKTTKVGSDTYQEYTTSVDGTTYTLLIDTDITTHIG